MTPTTTTKRTGLCSVRADWIGQPVSLARQDGSRVSGTLDGIRFEQELGQRVFTVRAADGSVDAVLASELDADKSRGPAQLARSTGSVGEPRVSKKEQQTKLLALAEQLRNGQSGLSGADLAAAIEAALAPRASAASATGGASKPGAALRKAAAYATGTAGTGKRGFDPIDPIDDAEPGDEDVQFAAGLADLALDAGDTGDTDGDSDGFDYDGEPTADVTPARPAPRLLRAVPKPGAKAGAKPATKKPGKSSK